MNKFSYPLVMTLAMLIAAAPANAQRGPQVINIPISKPGEPIFLKIEIQSARIEVVGEDREDAMFQVSIADAERRIVTPSGSQVIKGGAYALEIEEEDNEIYFQTDWRTNKVTVLARVPRQANLSLKTINDGEIIVSNITGMLELANVNGPITATGISGSVIAEAINDTITLSFDRIDDANATSFESINGDLHLGLPGNMGVQLQIDTAQGEIFSDYDDVEVLPSEPVVRRSDEDGGSAIRIENAIVAKVNGGGPVVRMKSLYGDIYIEKAE
jgi:hypothetical protein